MKPQEAVVRETLHILLGTLIMSIVMLAVYALVGISDVPAALFGALYGSAVAVLNFFALGITVQLSVKGIQDDDELKKRQARNQIQFSYSVRMLIVFGLMVLAIAVFKLNAITCLLPLLFPRITIAVMNAVKIGRRNAKESVK